MSKATTGYDNPRDEESALTPEELVEKYDEELLDQLEDTPMAPAVRAVRRVARGEFDE